MKSVCVYCASASGDKPSYEANAFELGRHLALNSMRLVYGGGGHGLMGAVAKGALSENGKVLGVIPHFMMGFERSLVTGIEAVMVEDMHTRKKMMFDESDAFIALPGGIGTLEELFEIMTWLQLHRHEKPIIIANFNGFYDTLLKFLRELSYSKFLRQELSDLFIVKDSVEDIMEFLKT